MGLNATLATARQSLDVFSAGVQLAGQNISNASTPGYIREQLLLEPGFSYQSGSLILGTGVVAAGVQQQINQYLELRIHAANAEVATASVKNLTYKQLESEIQELGESDLSTALSDFFDAIQNLASQPESVAFRDLAVSQGNDLARDIRSLYGRVDDLRQAQTVKVENLVTEANKLISQIQKLNVSIVQLESAGLSRSDAGAARSERYQALTRLSEILPIQYRELSTGAVDVFTESDYLLLSNTTQQLQIVNTGLGAENYRVELSKTGHDIGRAGGELRGVLESRDDVLGGFLGQLDDLTSNLISEFNQLHASGEGLSGFTSLLSTNQVFDSTLPLNQADNGLDFLPRHGTFEIHVENQQTGIRQTSTLSVDLDGLGADSSLEDIRAAIDGIANLSAVITPRGELQITAAAGYDFGFSNDTSGVLAALGINTFFTGSSAADIDVSGLLKANSGYLATGQGGGAADGRNVTRFTQFFERPLAGLNGATLNGFYEQTIAQVAQDSNSEDALAKGFGTFRDSLVSQQQQYTGVSLDEEAIKVLEFQREYQAAARIITTVNELFAVLLNL